MKVIEITDYCKRYDGVAAVEGVTLKVEYGELFGFIGPDGAGKTTLLRTICTLLTPDEGKILVMGKDVTESIMDIRSQVGYMPQRFSLYQDLSVEQNLHFFADLFGVKEEKRERRFLQLFEFSRLAPFKKRKAGDLSGGMKQKLSLCCALIHTPEILVLDEPTCGLDPVSRREFWEILRSIQKEKTTILVSTAYMDEADLCDRVALMHQGKITMVDIPEKIKSSFHYHLYRLEGKDVRFLRDLFKELPSVRSTQLFGDTVHVSFYKKPALSDWKSWQRDSGGNLERWVSQLPSMEDVFMESTETKR